MEELSGFVTDKLPDLENRAKTQVLRELEKRPYYGGFEPLLAAINRVPERQYPPSQAMQALGKHLDEEKVKKAFFDKVKDPSSPGRENYLHALVRSMDKEELENLSPGWIADSDDNFSQMAFSQVKSYDKGMALSLMERHFNDVSPAVRQIMLRGFDFSEEKHSAKVRGILEKSASQNEDKKLKSSALEVLGKAGYVSEIWNFLNTYVKSESDDRRREHIKNILIYNLRRAHPDEADEMLLDWLDDETGQIRFSAAMALLGQNDDKKAKLQALAEKLKGNVDDELVRGVVQAAYQYWKLRKGWDAEHLYEPLQEILKLGLNSPDEKVRERAREVVSRAVAAGDARYGELIN